MNKQHPFDELARAMAGGLTRREALKRVGSGFIGALVAAWGLGGVGTPWAQASTGPHACRDICDRSDQEYAGTCARFHQEDRVAIAARHESCLARCAVGGAAAGCPEACVRKQTDLEARVHASRHGCLAARARRRGVCLQICSGQSGSAA